MIEWQSKAASRARAFGPGPTLRERLALRPIHLVILAAQAGAYVLVGALIARTDDPAVRAYVGVLFGTVWLLTVMATWAGRAIPFLYPRPVLRVALIGFPVCLGLLGLLQIKLGNPF
ncbi:hypothetical protein QOZ96_003378 [Brevundimonas nasdae]|uniref:Iron transporter n=1 Tax=Brevundimonas nasdae TaxID=172043 RepID=A0ABX8TQE9_9CAUL|nr:hypothetical protein [Brevundimonas nasdae]MBK6026785.1 hypothetical protein [Brevundimonas nasdae]MDQ0453408.1 hypothetical protein [Brevundimonas nasdae]QYC12405.1 hypothetical protein KWG56_18350 [Brevundimonas nasdae]